MVGSWRRTWCGFGRPAALVHALTATFQGSCLLFVVVVVPLFAISVPNLLQFYVTIGTTVSRLKFPGAEFFHPQATPPRRTAVSPPRSRWAVWGRSAVWQALRPDIAAVTYQPTWNAQPRVPPCFESASSDIFRRSFDFRHTIDGWQEANVQCLVFHCFSFPSAM